MRLSHIETLLTALDEGSFTAAAQRLGVTQPSVSQAIARLERELGHRLLDRDRTGLTLTPGGTRLLPHLRALHHHHQHLLHEARRAPQPLTGKVRVGSFPSTSIHVLPSALQDLTERHPGVQVVVFEGLPHEITHWLEQGTIDLGFLEPPIPPALTFTPVLADEYVLVIPEHHPLAQLDVVPLADVTAYPFILSKFGCEPLLRRAFQEAGTQLRDTHEVRDLTTLVSMVQEHLGVTLLPALLMTAPPAGLTTRPVAPRIPRQIGLARPDSTGAAAPVAALWEVVTGEALPSLASEEHRRTFQFG